MTLKFECGCEFVSSQNSNGLVVNYDLSNINFNCEKTWALISDGNTKGVFQLESRLGQSMAKKLKPTDIEQLAALISIMRPGCLEAVRDGKTVSSHFIDKKNGQESIDYFVPELEPILKNTYGEMVYQEQAMEIAKDISGFNLQEADMLRKAIGKKKPEEMAKIKTKFLDGAEAVGKVNKDNAEQIFSWIEKSQRYSFNKSHAVSYAVNAYISAHAKAHFPSIFFLSYLRLAKDKINPQEEILELICNAKEMDIDIFGPDIRLKNREFEIHGKKIYFGLTSIKSVGDSVYEKLNELIKDIDLKSYSWTKMLFNILININSSAAKSLISCGAIDYLKLSRNQMLYEYNLISDLSNKETEQCVNIANQQNITTEDIIRHLLSNGKVTKNRQPKVLSILNQLNSPSYSMIDSPEWISDNERELLGASITCAKTDSYDSSYTNTDCKDIKNFASNKQFFIVGEIDSVNVIKTKKGKNPGQEMCFIKISDSYGSVDCVMFPDDFSANKELLTTGRVLMFNGQKGQKDNSVIVKKCFVV
jgi:DNA polymerase-3 subunit alpha